MRSFTFLVACAAALAAMLGLASPAQAKLYDRADREARVARGERLTWNTLDDFAGYGATDTEFSGNAIYSWAACLQMCFALAGYGTDQRTIIDENFADWRAFNPRSLPLAAYSGVYGRGSRELYFSGSTLPGRLAPENVINCIDHGSPVVLVVDTGQGRESDPLTVYRQGGQRLAIIHGYIWDTDQRTLVRTLWLDVFDPLPPDGETAQSVRVPYNRLAQAWGSTLSGVLVNSRRRQSVSQPSW